MDAPVAPATESRPWVEGLARHLPILSWLPNYQRAWLGTDLIAGLTVVALLVPEGMAYAQIAGMPPQAAFYAAPIGLLLFAILGSSRQLVVAVSAAIATMSYATVSLIAQPNTPEFIALTSALAVLAGVVSVVSGVLRLGRVAQFFSESVMVGFITGLALVIGVKQVPKILGFEAGHGNFWERLYDLVIHLPETHLLTLIVGLVCLALLVVLEHYFEKIPAALVALVAGIALSELFGLEARGVEVVGDIPAGLAAPQWPAVNAQDVWLLLPGAVGLALVCFAEAIGPARAFAAAHHYEIDADQEFIGLGAANVGAGLFQGFPIGSSLSKSAANDRAGARSQMSAIIAAAVTALVALFFTPWFYALPEATLGAIVVVAISGMVKVAKLKHLYRVRRADFALAAVALLAVLTFETLQALLLAVIVSLLALIWHASQPRMAVLGRAPNRLSFGDIRRHPENKTLPGLLMVRPESGLFFANASALREAIVGQVRTSAQPVTAVLIDLGATTDLDVPSADMLAELHEQLHGLHVRLILARVITPVRQMLERAGVLEKIGLQNLFVDLTAAVLDYLSSRTDQTVAGAAQPDPSLDEELRDLLRSGLVSARDLLQAHQPTAPAGRQAVLQTIVGNIDQAIELEQAGDR
jgi:sulfate permease, SulP family